jgi:hypothetical protein
VKPRFIPSSAFSLVTIGLLVQASSPAGAQVKPIRLRNGVIPAQAAQPGTGQAKPALAQSPTSGNFPRARLVLAGLG